jgi:hypothetical protein
MRYIYLISLLFFVSCRNKADVGTIAYSYEIICLAEDLQSGLNTNGDFHMTTQCIRSECFKVKRVLGSFKFTSDVLEKELVTIDKCIQ